MTINVGNHYILFTKELNNLYFQQFEDRIVDL